MQDYIMLADSRALEYRKLVLAEVVLLSVGCTVLRGGNRLNGTKTTGGFRKVSSSLSAPAWEGWTFGALVPRRLLAIN